MSRVPGPLQPAIADLITSHRSRSLWRHANTAFDWASGRGAVIEWFHDSGDPWSGLLAHVLVDLRQRFDISIRPYTVSQIDAPFRPEADRYFSYALHDTRMLADFHGLPRPERRPVRSQADSANARLFELEDDIDGYLAAAIELHARLYASDGEPIPHKSSAGPAENRKLLHKSGHYQSGMLRYRGAWYWGIDRLQLLEQILRKERRGNGSCIFSYPEQIAAWEGDTIELFFSFRSPYSYIILPRIYDIADRYDLKLELKPVLPMVSRGMEVPRVKRWYILHDAAREAFRHNVVFGRVRDPLGKGVENAIAVFVTLDDDYKRQFAWSAMNGAWARGLNLADRNDLEKVSLEAGLASWQVDEALAKSDWRAVTEKNREELFAIGLWGVPCFRVGENYAWGQDRVDVLRAGVARARALANPRSTRS